MKSEIKIESKHRNSMDKDTGLGPMGRRWHLHFRGCYGNNNSTAEIMGQDYYITALFLICIAFGIEIGLFNMLGWWWLWIQLALCGILVYRIIISNLKHKARINRFALRMNKKYTVPMDQAIQYWNENEKYLL